MKINIETIPPGMMRPCAALEQDDYWVDEDGVLQIRVLDQPDPKVEFPLTLHAFVEAALVIILGIDIEEIDKFDAGIPAGIDPGMLPDCPYRVPHQWATAAEFMAVAAMGKTPANYEKEIV